MASGTILQGTPDPSSDLDIYVIHSQPVRQRVQKWFHGVPAEIFVNPPAKIREYFRSQHKAARPATAHMLSTGSVILARDPVVHELRSEAIAWMERPLNPSSKELVVERYMAATLYEDARDVAARDPATAALLLGQSIVAMVQFWFRKNGHFLPRTKEQLEKLSLMDAELGKAAREFFLSPVEARWALAEEIAKRTIGVDGFFEWESDPEDVSEGRS